MISVTKFKKFFNFHFDTLISAKLDTLEPSEIFKIR